MKIIQPIFIIWQRELIRYWRDKARIFSTLFQPLMFLVIFGYGLEQAINGGNLGVNYKQFMYPGILAMSIMGVAFFSTISTVWDREFGFLKEILVAPIPRFTIALAKTLGATTIAASQGLILLAIAPIIGIQLEFIVIAKLFGLMLLLAFAISGLGLLIASLMRTTEGFGVLMQVIIFPMFFLSGAFFPLTAVPKWMEIISKINPLTYGVDSFRQVILDNPIIVEQLSLYPVYIDTLFLTFFAVIMVGLAVFAFNRKR